MISLPFCVGISPLLKIRGLIASQPIKSGELIEKCPVILVDKKLEESALKQTVLWKYYYEWNRKYHCIVLGYGGLINHSYTPNAKYVFDYKHNYLLYKAIKNISPGEEITVNYNWIPTDSTPLPPELLDLNNHFPG